MINDILNSIPNDVQIILFDGVNQLNDFLNGISDYPHNRIPIKLHPIEVKDIFYYIANTDITINYDRYTREQLYTNDLVINPQRFNSWLALLLIKINQMERIYKSIDVTK